MKGRCLDPSYRRGILPDRRSTRPSSAQTYIIRCVQSLDTVDNGSLLTAPGTVNGSRCSELARGCANLPALCTSTAIVGVHEPSHTSQPPFAQFSHRCTVGDNKTLHDAISTVKPQSVLKRTESTRNGTKTAKDVPRRTIWTSRTTFSPAENAGLSPPKSSMFVKCIITNEAG
jgi:hypothetical protein